MDAAPAINAYAQAWSVRKSQLEVADVATQGNEWVDYEVYRWLAAQLPQKSIAHSFCQFHVGALCPVV